MRVNSSWSVPNPKPSRLTLKPQLAPSLKLSKKSETVYLISFSSSRLEENICKMKENNSKDGTSEGKRRNKALKSHDNLSSGEVAKTVRRKNKDEVLRRKKKKQHNNQKIQPQEAQKHDDDTNADIGEGVADENERLEQNQIEKAFGRKKNDVALRKNNKKRKVQKIKPEEEQNCDGNTDYDIGEGNVDENDTLAQKQRKTKKKKGRNVMRATEDNICKTQKAREAEIVEHLPTKGDQDLHLEKNEDEVYQIPSEDETSSQGMRKWMTDYYQSRPGLNALQEKIDEFITAHEADEEQARIEKEEKAAEGGWTVVVHHKGRKKTTDAESGIAVGSVSQAAVMDKMASKKNKDVGLDFYRFQKREAKRNEIVLLRSKFEQDKKRMQELRAQRKFRPY